MHWLLFFRSAPSTFPNKRSTLKGPFRGVPSRKIILRNRPYPPWHWSLVCHHPITLGWLPHFVSHHFPTTTCITSSWNSSWDDLWSVHSLVPIPHLNLKYYNNRVCFYFLDELVAYSDDVEKGLSNPALNPSDSDSWKSLGHSVEEDQIHIKATNSPLTNKFAFWSKFLEKTSYALS